MTRINSEDLNLKQIFNASKDLQVIIDFDYTIKQINLSYLEYLGKVREINRICYYEDLIDTSASSYKNFVEDRISYQRELEKIKHLILE